MSARYDSAVMCLACVLYVIVFYLSGDKTGLICFSAPRTRELARVRDRRPAPGRAYLACPETCNSQLVAGYLACGRVADDASNAPPGSRSRRFLDVEDQAGDLLLVEGS